MDISRLTKFLSTLKKNNNKDWFDENRSEYKELREQFVEIVGELIFRISEFDHSIAHKMPKDCMFRINRDVRFSKNKSPYKPHFSAAFSPAPKKSQMAGYYLRLDAEGNLWAGGGIWQPAGDELAAIRESIDQNPAKWLDILEAKKFKKNFELTASDKLKTAPKGYPKDHPQIELLRLKHFAAMHKVNLKKERKNIVTYAGKMFEEIAPLVKMVNRVIQ